MAAKSVNYVRLIGHLGKDPEMKFTQSGLAIANFSVATKKSWKDKGSDEWKEATTWHNVVAWRQLAEKCGQMLAKGKQVCVEGELTNETYEKEGQKHYVTKITASEVYVIEKQETVAQAAPTTSGAGTPPPETQGEPVSDLPF